METAPITYRSYHAIFMEFGPSFWSTMALIRDFTSRKGLQSKLAMVFMIATMIYALAFPTVASAMTGYTSVLKAYIPDHGKGNMIHFDNFQVLLYTVHDGVKAGLGSDEYFVTTGGDYVILRY